MAAVEDAGDSPRGRPAGPRMIAAATSDSPIGSLCHGRDPRHRRCQNATSGMDRARTVRERGERPRRLRGDQLLTRVARPGFGSAALGRVDHPGASGSGDVF